MPTSVKRAGFWDDQVWAAIDDGVRKAVGAIRVAQRVFPSVQLANANAVPAESFSRVQMNSTEGVTKPYIELAVRFRLTNGQVNADPTGTAAINLARRAATYLANAEDLIILQGAGWTPPGASPPGGVPVIPVPPPVDIVSGDGSIVQGGILGMAAGSVPVNPPGAPSPRNSGENILKAIEDAIARLTKDLQAAPFALILSTDAFAAASSSVINGVPTKNVLTPLLAGGIYSTAAMPEHTGLLTALGGEPTIIYFGSDPATEPTHQGSSGEYSFRTFERIQYVARDPDAFVKVDFS